MTQAENVHVYRVQSHSLTSFLSLWLWAFSNRRPNETQSSLPWINRIKFKYTTRLTNKGLAAFRHFNADILMRTTRCELWVTLVRSDFSVEVQCVFFFWSTRLWWLFRKALRNDFLLPLVLQTTNGIISCTPNYHYVRSVTIFPCDGEWRHGVAAKTLPLKGKFLMPPLCFKLFSNIECMECNSNGNFH